MFSTKLNLPTHVRLSVDPKPNDPQHVRLTITAWNDQQSSAKRLGADLPVSIGALDFGKRLLSGINSLYDQLRA